MPSAALLLNGTITPWPRMPDVEPWNLGVVTQTSEMPFDILKGLASASVEFPFWIEGYAVRTSVLPFDLGPYAVRTSVLPFDLLGASDFLIEAIDLGDGESVAATASPVYGWWEGGADTDMFGLDSLGTEL